MALRLARIRIGDRVHVVTRTGVIIGLRAPRRRRVPPPRPLPDPLIPYAHRIITWLIGCLLVWSLVILGYLLGSGRA